MRVQSLRKFKGVDTKSFDSDITRNKVQSRFEKLAFRMISGTIFIRCQDISFIKSDNIYCYLYDIYGNEYFILNQMKIVDKMLSAHNFYRVHRSYLINLDKIFMYKKKDGGSIIMDCGGIVPISRSKRTELVNLLEV